MNTKLYSKPTVSGVIWTAVTAPFWFLAGFGCILCIATAGTILWCYDLIRRKK